MRERDDFLAMTIPRQIEAETALHNGDVTPRMAMWSRSDPVTLFGAAVSASGWADVSRTFEWLASIFSDCDSHELEMVAAGASGDLAYTVGYEHTSAAVEGARRTYSLRVTHVYRREDGQWKIVHRHADPASPLDIPSPPQVVAE